MVQVPLIALIANVFTLAEKNYVYTNNTPYSKAANQGRNILSESPLSKHPTNYVLGGQFLLVNWP